MDLVPYVESIIWGCQKCNIDCIKAFEEFIIATFGLEAFNQIVQFTKVTPEVPIENFLTQTYKFSSLKASSTLFFLQKKKSNFILLISVIVKESALMS